MRSTIYPSIWLCLVLVSNGIYGLEGEDGSQYTTLSQITPDNVKHLQLAFTYRTGDLNRGFRKAHSFQTTPSFWQGKISISTSNNLVMAVDGKNGEEVWRYDAKLDHQVGYSESSSPGVAIWHGSNALCRPQTIIFAPLEPARVKNYGAIVCRQQPTPYP